MDGELDGDLGTLIESLVTPLLLGDLYGSPATVLLPYLFSLSNTLSLSILHIVIITYYPYNYNSQFFEHNFLVFHFSIISKVLYASFTSRIFYSL